MIEGGWVNYFIASAGASAALAGLTFVAVSVNISEILRYRPLPVFAGATIASLVLVLVVSLCALIQQPVAALGAEIAALAAVVWTLHLIAAAFILRESGDPRLTPGQQWSTIASEQFQVLPILAGGIVLACGAGAGIYLVGAGFVAAFALTMVSTWILLIEIRR